MDKTWRKLYFGGRIPAAVLAVMVLLFLATSGSQAQNHTILHSFTGGIDGANPFAALTVDRGGNLYGAASGGGRGSCPPINGYAAGCGVIFKLTHKPTGWIETVLYSFQGSTDGAHPQARLVFGPDGRIYGTTVSGGSFTGNCASTGCGTVFRLSPPAATCPTSSCSWKIDVLYTFSGDGFYDMFPSGALSFDSNGNIYGTTQNGEVYELSPSHGSWTHSMLFNFNSPLLGEFPMGGVVPDAQGNLYGALKLYGTGGDGVIFQLVNTGNGWVENQLYVFQQLEDGSEPVGGLIWDRFSSGCLIGSTSEGPFQSHQEGSGTIFKVCPSNGGAWTFQTLYVIPSSSPQMYLGPLDAVLQSSTGEFFGTWSEGAFRIGSDGYTLLVDLDGLDPVAGLVQDASATLYGTTVFGGAYGYGMVYAVTP